MPIEEKLYTIEEFLKIAQLRENENKRLELIGGAIKVIPPSKSIDSVVGARIAYFIGNYVDEHGIGYVTGAGGGYQLGPNTILTPNVGCISKERAGGLDGMMFSVAPDVAVEVVSAGEAASHMLAKGRASLRAGIYLYAGTYAVWAVDSVTKVIDVYSLADNNTIHSEEIDINGVLDGGIILPGFSLAVKEIFKGLEDADH